MEAWLGSSPDVFLGLTVGVFGGCGWLTGQGMASRWRSEPQVLVYALALAVGERFLAWGMFQSDFWSLWGGAVHGATVIAITLAAFRLGRARRMVSQYPWLYCRDGLFGWVQLHPDR